MMSARYKFEVFMTNPYCNKCYYSFLKILHAKTSYFIKELKKAFFIAHIFFITVGAILNLYLGLKKNILYDNKQRANLQQPTHKVVV